MSAQPTHLGKRGEEDTEEGENQPNISPPVLEPYVQRGVILIPNRDGAVPTKRGFSSIIQVAAKVLNEIIGTGCARLTQRCVEDREFFRVSGDLEAAGKAGKEVVRKRVLFSQKERGTYRTSVESSEAVIPTQGLNS